MPVGGLTSIKGLRRKFLGGPLLLTKYFLPSNVKSIAILVDGGHVRAYARKAAKEFDANLIEQLAISCAKQSSEEIHRILFYDCGPYEGRARLPVSGDWRDFTGSDYILRELALRPLFAVRRGVLKFRGWVPKRIPVAGRGLSDHDFKANFEQKGVDMRIGLDMANYAANRSVELVALFTNDTDCIPAMKYARRSGLQVTLVCIPGYSPAPELLAHCDTRRDVPWPSQENIA